LNRIVALYESNGNVRRFTYDGFDNVIRVLDRHQDVQYAYRGLGRLIRRVEAGATVEFWHNTEEQLRAIVNEQGLAHRFELDRKGEVVAETGFDGLTRRYQRNLAGQIVKVEALPGQHTLYEHNSAGRLTDVRYSDGTWEHYAYRPDGALLAATNEVTTVSYVRDILGNVLLEAQGNHTITNTEVI
jgi:YD repeat-containing protein